MTLGGVAMYGVVVVLPALQAEVGVTRAEASLPYTLTMIGFGFGGILMGALADRCGVIVPVLIGSATLGVGMILAGMSASLLQFALAHGVLAGFLGCSATFAPLVADASLWFTRRRGIAVAIVISGNYLAGTVWPPLLQHFFDSAGWRRTYIGFGIVSRLGFGWIADRIGGLRTLLLGSALQGIALALFLPFDGLVSLYVVSALFGLFQGGLVPAYPIIVREFFSPREAGTRVAI